MTDDKQPDSKLAFDFRVAPRLSHDIPVDADVYLSDALEAIKRRGPDSRAALIKILDGMVLL